MAETDADGGIDYAADVKPWLDLVLDLTQQASSAIPGPGGVAVRFIAAALRWGSDLAAQGADPVAAIERVHAADPLLADVEDAWAAAIRRKFPQGGT